jgi:uncharacterized protein
MPVNWYLAIRRMTEPPASWRDLLPAHLAWLKDMHDTGTIIMSGPGTEPRLGIYIMRAPGSAEATRIVHADPLLQSPGATVEVTEWQLHQIMGIGGFDAGASRGSQPPSVDSQG